LNVPSILKSERVIIGLLVAICGVILLGVLIGLWRYGIDLATVFLGTPWDSSLEHSRGTIAIEGGVVAVTLLFGGLFIAGVMAMVKRA
jgi:hypothetical protein